MLEINGEIVTGIQQPVIPLSEIPGSATIEDAYAVYYIANTGPLSPGSYPVTVTYSFEIPVTDGFSYNSV